MAWTAPTTRATADLITAGIWNTDLVNNLKEIWRDGGTTQTAGNTTISATSAATANTIVTAPAFVSDGVQAVTVEFASGQVAVGASQLLTFRLYDGSTDLGNWGLILGTYNAPVFLKNPNFVPSAASHTYSIRAFVDSSTATVHGDMAPCYVKLQVKGAA